MELLSWVAKEALGYLGFVTISSRSRRPKKMVQQHGAEHLRNCLSITALISPAHSTACAAELRQIFSN